MNDEQALVDEIVRRVLEQLPGVAAVLRSDALPTPSGTPVSGSAGAAASIPASAELPPDPPRTEPVFAETNSTGRFLPAPEAWNAAPVAVSPATVSVTTVPAPAPSPPAASVSITPPSAAAVAGVAVVAPPANDKPALAAPASSLLADEVTILERVITAEVLLRDLRGARRVVIAPKALLTPTAQDVIRSRRLEIVRQSAAPRAASAAPRRRWLIVVGQALPGVTAAVGAWRNAGGLLETTLVGTAAEAAARAISAICRGEADEVLVISTQPESVACLANRNEAVRGVVLVDAAAVSRLRESLRPNVWVVDATPRGNFDLASLLTHLDR